MVKKLIVKIKWKSMSNLYLNFIKKTPTQVFYCEYCEIFKNTYFQEHL